MIWSRAVATDGTDSPRSAENTRILTCVFWLSWVVLLEVVFCEMGAGSDTSVVIASTRPSSTRAILAPGAG